MKKRHIQRKNKYKKKYIYGIKIEKNRRYMGNLDKQKGDIQKRYTYWEIHMKKVYMHLEKI